VSPAQDIQETAPGMPPRRASLLRSRPGAGDLAGTGKREAVSAAIRICPLAATKKTPWPSQNVTGFARRRIATLPITIGRFLALLAYSSLLAYSCAQIIHSDRGERHRYLPGHTVHSWRPLPAVGSPRLAADRHASPYGWRLWATLAARNVNHRAYEGRARPRSCECANGART
jgi:hypothetical protein